MELPSCSPVKLTNIFVILQLSLQVKENPTNEMVKTVEAHNDYFSCQLLLSFVVPGIHSVFVEAAVQDEDGVVWKTGPRSQMTVKCYDEAVHRQQQHQYAAAKSKMHAR